jgi:RNA polymerase sigma-70 factor (ECF subfamily)
MSDGPQDSADNDLADTDRKMVSLPTAEELVDRFLQDVYAYALRLCRSPAEAEELTQQVFLLAHQRRHQLRDPSRARSWLLSITRNGFLQARRSRQPICSTDLDLDMSDIRDGSWKLETIDAERLQQAVQSLPDPFRVVVLMYYFEEMSYQEIARTLDIPIGTVMSRLARARQRLRDGLTAVAAGHEPGGV